VKTVKNVTDQTLIFPTLDPPLSLAPGEVGEANVEADIDLIGTEKALKKDDVTAGDADAAAAVPVTDPVPVLTDATQLAHPAATVPGVEPIAPDSPPAA